MHLLLSPVQDEYDTVVLGDPPQRSVMTGKKQSIFCPDEKLGLCWWKSEWEKQSSKRRRNMPEVHKQSSYVPSGTQLNFFYIYLLILPHPFKVCVYSCFMMYWVGQKVRSVFHTRVWKNKWNFWSSQYISVQSVHAYSIAQSCLTLCDPMYCSRPGSSVHWFIFYLGKNTEVGCHFLLQGIFPTQESNPHLLWLLHWQADSLPLIHLGSPCKYSPCTWFLNEKI